MNTTPLSLATLENAFFKNLHNQPAAEELHLIHHKSGPPSPDGARSKAFFPAGAGQNLRLRRDWSLSNCDVLSPDFQGRRPVLTLLRQEKVGNFCFLKISRMSCISSSVARFRGFPQGASLGSRRLTLLRRRRPATQEQAPILIFWYFLVLHAFLWDKNNNI